MIDLHCHLLPGIDDGAANLEEALALARAAVANGIRRAVMTPHLHPGRWENFAPDIAAATRRFQQALTEAGIALEIGYAAEVRLSPEIPLLIRQNRVPFLGEMDGYRMMLLEFPHGHIPLGADKLVAHLLAMNVRPVIAHPERNKDVMRDPGKLAPFLAMGCILQLTAASVCGRFGERAQSAAQALLASDATLILATDAHNLDARPPLLREGLAVAAQLVGQERAQAMADTLPNRIAASQFGGPAHTLATAVPDAAAPAARQAVTTLHSPAPAPQGQEQGQEQAQADGACAGQSPEQLLLRLIDARIQQGAHGGEPAGAAVQALARQYHRALRETLLKDLQQQPGDASAAPHLRGDTPQRETTV